MSNRDEDEPSLLAKPVKKPHGNAKEINWDIFDALFIPCSTKQYACDYLGISDTHLDNQLQEKYGMTFTEYKEFLLQDAVLTIKCAMFLEARKGDVAAAKYVLNNIGDWNDKQAIDLTNKGAPIQVTVNYKKKSEVANEENN